jgi:hypothetical protein
MPPKKNPIKKEIIPYATTFSPTEINMIKDTSSRIENKKILYLRIKLKNN